ncbi:DMT family transporter [Pseudoalteromonas denitrificans]|uniref:EamA domain-containing membrane protein RarD n=1 Tax=Pseudoalteromonas denitrificans DSM 6059 TaxID=1123010 RepID=A0A1I1NR01_9GAMM|nr:DMT family transporter [Pseudoalteromonas denitrificans]SFC97948.1 EamA domain-containing membrane protein RarD [Pseudoalteromonas denitrificans DSM 6059]
MQVKHAITLIIIAEAIVAFGTLIVKQLGVNIPVYQLILYRQLFASLLVLPLILREIDGFKLSPFIKIHLFRGLLIGLGNASFLIAIMHLSLITVTAAMYISPILLVILSHLFLNEKPDLKRYISVVIGFIGILLITKPMQSNLYILLAFFGALVAALNSICLKKLSNKEHPMVTLFWSNLVALFMLVPAVIWEGAQIKTEIISVGFCLALLYIAMTYLFISALRFVDASKLAPAEYTGLVFSALLGYWFFNDEIDSYSLLGICVIFLSLMPISQIKLLKRKAKV